MANALTEEKVIEIYEDLKNHSTKELVEKYEVSIATINRIKNKKTQKYKKIIDNYLSEKKTEEKVTESTEWSKINKDGFAITLFNVLVKYTQPEIAKYLIDKYVLSDKVKLLIDGLIIKINEVAEYGYLTEASTIIIASLLQKIYPQNIYNKIFNGKLKVEDEIIK